MPHMDMETGEVHQTDVFGDTWCSYEDPDVDPEAMDLVHVSDQVTCEVCIKAMEEDEAEHDD